VETLSFNSQSRDIYEFVKAVKLHYWLVPWLSGRTLVFDRRAFAVLRSTYSRRVTTYVGKLSAIGQPTRPTQPLKTRYLSSRALYKSMYLYLYLTGTHGTLQNLTFADWF